MHPQRPSITITEPNAAFTQAADTNTDWELGCGLDGMFTFPPAGDDQTFLTSYSPSSPSLPLQSPTSLSPQLAGLGLTSPREPWAPMSFDSLPSGAAPGVTPNDRQRPHIQTDFRFPSSQSAYSSADTTSASTHFSSLLPSPIDLPYNVGTAPVNFQPRVLYDPEFDPMLTMGPHCSNVGTLDPRTLSVTSSPRGRSTAGVPFKRRPRSLSATGVYYNPRAPSSAFPRVPHSELNSPHGALERFQKERGIADDGVSGADNDSGLPQSLLFQVPSELPGVAAPHRRAISNPEIELTEDLRAPRVELDVDEITFSPIQRSTVASDDVLRASRGRRKDKHAVGFKCPVCSQDFTARHNLTNHMFAHKGIKRFRCPHCEKRYTTKHVLDRHLKTAVGCKKLRAAASLVR